MATVNERRINVRDEYRTIIGRNKYSQPLRNYCFKKYKDGKYYSDCSSSISYCYKQAGESFGILNTVGMYNSKKMVDVPVIIKKGIIQNPEVLRIGDILLFAGNNTSRKAAGYVGHVEMVGEISDGKYTLYGHGSGRPKKQEMNAYCKKRYNSKTSTPLGRALLIKVRRIITDNDTPTLIIQYGEKNNLVKEIQQMLLQLDKNCLPKYGADGSFGNETKNAIIDFQIKNNINGTGLYDKETDNMLRNLVSLLNS